MIDRFGWSSNNFGDFFFGAERKSWDAFHPIDRYDFQKKFTSLNVVDKLLEASFIPLQFIYLFVVVIVFVVVAAWKLRAICIEFSSVSPMAIYYKRFLHRILFIHTTRHNSCWSLLLYENRPMYATTKSLKSIEKKKNHIRITIFQNRPSSKSWIAWKAKSVNMTI